MSQKIYPFTDTADYVKVNTEVSSGKGRLGFVDLPLQEFEEDFADDTDFEYDPNRAQFDSGRVEQKRSEPTGLLLSSDFEDGNLTAEQFEIGAGSAFTTHAGGPFAVVLKTPTNAPASMMLDNATSPGVGSYPLPNGLNMGTNLGGWRFDYVPNFNGHENGFGVENIMRVGSFGFNIIDYHVNLIHDAPSGNKLRLTFSHSGAGSPFGIVYDVTPGAFAFVADQKYKFEIYWDNQGGLGSFLIYVFLDEVLLTTIDTGAVGVRSTFAGGQLLFEAPGWYDNVRTYNTIITSDQYLENAVNLPNFVYTGLGEIQSLDNFSSDGEGTERYAVDGKYWNGSAWVASNLTFAQANTEADVATNINSIVLDDPEQVQVSIIFQTGTTQQYVENLTLGFTGQQYALTGSLKPIPAEAFEARSITGFDATFTEPGVNQKVRFIFDVGGVEYYHDGANWVPSNGTIPQSNTLVQVQNNFQSLINELDEVPVLVKTLLDTTDQQVTPDIDQITVSSFEITECLITASLFDIFGATPVIDPLNPPKLHVTATRAFTNGNVFIAGTKTANFDVNGNASISIAVTEMVGEKMEFLITLPDGRNTKFIFFEPAIIPNIDTKPLHEVTQVRKYDFG